MKWAQLLLVSLISVLCRAQSSETVQINGTEGGKIQLECKYPAKYQNQEKYFCRHPCRSSSDVLVRTMKHESVETRGRFTLYDYTSYNYIIVWMNNVRLTDSGKYYCGISLFFQDVYIGMNIKVLPGSSAAGVTRHMTATPLAAGTTATSPPTGFYSTHTPVSTVGPRGENTTVGNSLENSILGCSELLVGSLLALIVLAILLITIICRKRRKKLVGFLSAGRNRNAECASQDSFTFYENVPDDWKHAYEIVELPLHPSPPLPPSFGNVPLYSVITQK
ncbi:CMRF35-like molecule 5 isoform X2 [Erpetoichthys calabaricus]|uniref:CMRF35-like molecule 5 isoform X2 n=1 Tax=Erpetoichthys calabaricus TaxID=27687 RepID=UPI0022346F6F|nr:CMRF35-like molecule 5 isoform X2 [Erpetoichthys calabaricus]